MQEGSATNVIHDQCITRYYDRRLGKVSNPYYVWYHNKNKDHKAENWDDSGSVLTAEENEYFTAALPEQQSNFPPSDREYLFGAKSMEDDISSTLINDDIIFLTSDAASDATEEINPLTFIPITNDNDLEKIPTNSFFDEEEEEDADPFSNSLFFAQSDENLGSESLSFFSQDPYEYSEDAPATLLDNPVDYSLGFAIASSSFHFELEDLSLLKRAWRGLGGWVLGG